MKKSLVILLAVAGSLAACNSEKKGPGGLLYSIYKSEGKEKIKEGDFVKVDFIQTNDKDSIVYSTYDANNPQIFPVGKKTYDGDMNDVLFLFGEGDSVKFRINIDTMVKYTNQPRPEQLKNDKYMNYTVKIHKVFTKKANEADSTYQKRANDFFQADYKATMDKRKNSEEAIIKKYIADNNLKTKTTPSGLHYVITAPGTGAKPAVGDTAMVDYTGKFTAKKSDGNDNVFDTSVEAVYKKTMRPNPQATFGVRPIVIGDGVVKGFVEALQMIGKGGKITAIIPSKLGYGEQGGGPIAPYSPLVFDVELKDIKKPVAGTVPATAPAMPTAN
jgi:FKBP-type peptidyl-prolyl cis-trans isomerase FkpA